MAGSEYPLVPVSAPVFELLRTRAEKERARKARDRTSWASSSKPHHKPGRQDGKIPYSTYPFVMWDGEAPRDVGYSLFKSSAGHRLCAPGLDTESCFDLLLEAKRDDPQTIYVIFGGRYDFDEIIRANIPVDRLARIKWYGSTTWHGYTIKQAEGKWFQISKNRITVRVFETFGWAHCKFTKALRDYGIGTEEELELLESEKNRRAEFLWSEMAEIEEYCDLELKLGATWMERIREICLQAGFSPRAWYGPSALAVMLLNQHKIKTHMSKCPPEVNAAARNAFVAGRFEMFRGGILSPVYSWDINAAYIRAMLELPSLAGGTWRRGRYYEQNKFAVYKIRFTNKTAFDHMTPMPLPRRLPNGTITWPGTVESWYWTPEAELVKDDPRAEFLDAWVFEPVTTVKPFAFMTEIFERRLLLKRLNNPAQLPFKWGMNAVFGQMCRVVGWDQFRKEPPKYHQLEWAGYITSWCRAQVYRLAIQAGDKLISIDTDSVTAMCPLDVEEGEGLGQWKAGHAEKGLFYQSGIYYLWDGDSWSTARLRGIDFRSKKPPVDPGMLEASIRDGKDIRIRPKARYVSIRQSLGWGLKHQGEWITPKDLETLRFGGQGKRQHNAKRCGSLCSGDMHCFVPVGTLGLIKANGEEIDFERVLYYSEPHALPWLGEERIDKNILEDIMWVDPNRMDSDDYWLAELLP